MNENGTQTKLRCSRTSSMTITFNTLCLHYLQKILLIWISIAGTLKLKFWSRTNGILSCFLSLLEWIWNIICKDSLFLIFVISKCILIYTCHFKLTIWYIFLRSFFGLLLLNRTQLVVSPVWFRQGEGLFVLSFQNQRFGKKNPRRCHNYYY